MLILFICIFFVFYFKLQSQFYNEFITQAYSCAYIENDFNRAAFLFEKTFEKCNFIMLRKLIFILIVSLN